MNKFELLKKIFKSMKQLIKKYILITFFRKQIYGYQSRRRKKEHLIN